MSTSARADASPVAPMVAAAAVLHAGLSAFVLAGILVVLHEVRLVRSGVDAGLAGADSYVLPDAPWWSIALAVVGAALVVTGAARLVRATTGSSTRP